MLSPVLVATRCTYSYPSPPSMSKTLVSALNSPIPIFTPGWGEALLEKCLAQELDVMIPARLKSSLRIQPPLIRSRYYVRNAKSVFAFRTSERERMRGGCIRRPGLSPTRIFLNPSQMDWHVVTRSRNLNLRRDLR